MRRELKNTSPEALELLRNRVTFYYVPKHLIGKALGFDRLNKIEEEKKKNLKKEEEEKTE
jgi:hypothetical protein